MSTKSISVIGASGFIGGHLYNYTKSTMSSQCEVYGTYYHHKSNDKFDFVDITDFESISGYLEAKKPAYLLLLSGDKNVKHCEGDYDQTYKLNVGPIKTMVKIINKKKLNTRIIFFSSDYVFNGQKGGYLDKDELNPITIYGKTKKLAEEFLATAGVPHIIVRPTAVIGKGGTFWEWLLSAIKNDKTVTLFNNTYFTPTPINLLCESIVCIIDNFDDIEGEILHIVGDKKYSRYELGVLVSDLLGVNSSKIQPEVADFKHSLFQKDLSMIASRFIKQNVDNSTESQIKGMLKDD